VTISSAIGSQHDLIRAFAEDFSNPVYYFWANTRLIAEKDHYGVGLRVDCSDARAVRRSAALAEHWIVDDRCTAELYAFANFISRSAKDYNNLIERV